MGGCLGPSKPYRASSQILADLEKQYPGTSIEGPEERAGLGVTKKTFGKPLKNLMWTLGGTGEISAGTVQDASMTKTAQANLSIDRLTGVFRASTIAKGTIKIKDANIVHLYHLNGTTVDIDSCNVCLISENNQDTTITVRRGRIIAVDNGDIVVKKGPGVVFQHCDTSTPDFQLVKGDAAMELFYKVRNNKPAKMEGLDGLSSMPSFFCFC
mmetsp:Transcript_73889/g.228283  ORF Transcript_73889/g.228283 Transcript_73889/m.228283 type:complete len:212 (+) Transcript_73889:53-688(+)